VEKYAHIHGLKIKKIHDKRGISKAYDRVDCGFLRGVLMRMGFNEKWIQWMMMCVSSVTYSVLMNFDKVELTYKPLNNFFYNKDRC